MFHTQVQENWKKYGGRFYVKKRRIAWFNDAYKKAVQGKCDVIIVPTATYRYLRTLGNSYLKESPVPVIFVFME